MSVCAIDEFMSPSNVDSGRSGLPLVARACRYLADADLTILPRRRGGEEGIWPMSTTTRRATPILGTGVMVDVSPIWTYIADRNPDAVVAENPCAHGRAPSMSLLTEDS